MSKEYKIKIVESLKDTDSMPFGKHAGKTMSDVPASYLWWLWNNGMHKQTRTQPVAGYILKHKDALMQETPDLIWN